MFRYLVLVLLLCTAASVSAGQVARTSQESTNKEIRQQYAANLAKAAKEQEESHQRNVRIMARTEALLTRNERITKREEVLLTQHEEMMKREKKDFARFEKILNVWEQQQAQYQKYLDSLGTK